MIGKIILFTDFLKNFSIIDNSLDTTVLSHFNVEKYNILI